MKNEERGAITLMNQGEKIFGILHRPLKSTKIPAIVICSGFAGNKCGKFRLFVRLAEELAKNGIAVLRFDYRGSGDSEGSFNDITVDGKVSDTMQCLDYLRNDSQIDSDRIGLLGRSLGGAISVLAAKQSRMIKSLALWAPVFNSTPWKILWESFVSNKLSSNQKQQIHNLPAAVPNMKFLEQFFQLHLEADLESLKNIPLLHIEASKDEIVKHEQSEAYHSARHNLDNTRFVKLDNSDHDFSDFGDQKIAISETCHWFQQTLSR